MGQDRNREAIAEPDFSSITAVGFDADDTLWHSERYFLETESQIFDLMAQYTDPDGLKQRFQHKEIENLSLYGYGVKGHILSVIEAALEVTDDQINGTDIRKMIDYGRDLLMHPINLLEGAEDIIKALHGKYRLLLITKGDFLHQESKISRSGLAEYFDAIEIVQEKDPYIYKDVLKRNHVHPSEFLMIGNSPKSDCVPVVAIGGQAIHVPYETLWDHDRADDKDMEGIPVIDNLKLLQAIL